MVASSEILLVLLDRSSAPLPSVKWPPVCGAKPPRHSRYAATHLTTAFLLFAVVLSDLLQCRGPSAVLAVTYCGCCRPLPPTQPPTSTDSQRSWSASTKLLWFFSQSLSQLLQLPQPWLFLQILTATSYKASAALLGVPWLFCGLSTTPSLSSHCPEAPCLPQHLTTTLHTAFSSCHSPQPLLVVPCCVLPLRCFM